MNDKQCEDFALALSVLKSKAESAPPRVEPKVEPVNGIVQPAVMPPPHRKGRNTNLLLKLRTTVNVMLRDKSSAHFRHPVNAVKQGILDYHQKIDRPMDLNTIKKRLEYVYYWSGADLLEDMRLIFENCKTYNSPNSPVYQNAVTLCELFWLRMEKLQPELHSEVKVEPRSKGLPKRPLPIAIKAERQPETKPKAGSVRIPLQANPCPDRSSLAKAAPFRPLLANAAPFRPSLAQIRSVPLAARGRGRGRPRLTQILNSPQPAPISALSMPRIVKFNGVRVKIEPKIKPPPQPEPQGLGVDLTPLDREIERRHSQSLLRLLRAKRDSWPFNDSEYWKKFGEDPDYDHDEERLDWGILETLVAGQQFEGITWFVNKIHRMLENAMFCFLFNPSVRTSTQRIHATVERVMPQLMERIANTKERAHEGVRLKLDAMTPTQIADLFK